MLKLALGHRLLIIFSTALFVILSFYFANTLFGIGAVQVQAQNPIPVQSYGVPVRLIVPAISVDASVQHVGITPLGEMAVPSNTVDVGWYDLGVIPGEVGSAVVAGHVDGKNGDAGVFTELNKLKAGDKLYVEGSNSQLITFVVRESRIYDPGLAEDVFSPADSAHLNLVTCDGVWDGASKSYSKRLVVFADIL